MHGTQPMELQIPCKGMWTSTLSILTIEQPGPAYNQGKSIDYSSGDISFSFFATLLRCKMTVQMDFKWSKTSAFVEIKKKVHAMLELSSFIIAETAKKWDTSWLEKMKLNHKQLLIVEEGWYKNKQIFFAYMSYLPIKGSSWKVILFIRHRPQMAGVF